MQERAEGRADATNQEQAEGSLDLPTGLAEGSLDLPTGLAEEREGVHMEQSFDDFGCVD